MLGCLGALQPKVAMSCRSVSPLSATSVATSFLTPCELPLFSAAASHALWNQLPNDSAVNGSPRNVCDLVLELAAMVFFVAL